MAARPTGRVVAVAAVVVAAVVVAGVWWLLGGGDAPPPASLPDRPTASGTTAAPSAGGEGPSGTWTVVRGERDVFVGYRVREQFAGELVEQTAVGRTRDVTGTLVLDGRRVTEVEVVADLKNLVSDRSRRDSSLRIRGLETDDFPTATFRLSTPIELPVEPAVGEPVAVTAEGDLTLHGTTRSVSVPLEARWNGDTIDVAGGTTLRLADFGIDVIDNAVVRIAPEGELELQLTFERS